jgi:hypothetical protein
MYDPEADDWEPGWPPSPPPPPTERGGIKVGDRVVIVGIQGQEWPADVIGFNSLPDDVVVRWTGVHPGLDRESTICRSHVREVRHAT